MASAAVRALIARIESAFPDAPPPPFDRRLDNLVPEDAAVFRRTRWRAIVSDKLPYDAVFFFSDRQLRYYLPAYLVAALRWPRRAAKGNLHRALVGSLVAPRRNDPDRAAFFARMDPLALEQKRVVRACLWQFAAEFPCDPEAPRALRRYWAQYE